MGRKDITAKLLQAGTGHFVKLRFGVFHELGVIPWGHRRADMVCINQQGKIVIVEVKSCKADFTSDKKYHEYLPFCHRMYILVPPNSDWIKEYSQDLKQKGIGVLYLCPVTGYLKTLHSAKIRPMKKEDKRNIIFRMCFRAATFSKKNTKRYKVFL